MEIDVSIRAGHTFPIILLVIFFARKETIVKVGDTHILEWNIR